MKKFFCLLLSLCLIIGIISFADWHSDITPSVSIEDFTEQVKEINQKYKDEPVSNRLIVKSKYNVSALDSVAIAEGYDDLHIIQFDNSQSATNALDYYEKQKQIEYAETDMTLSTCETTGITYDNHLSWGSESIGVDDYIDYLDDVSNLPEIIVGIIDTGIDLDHEFLQNRIIETNFNLSGTGNQNSEDDDNGHGTHVAGIVADNTTENVKIKAYKCLDVNGSGDLLNVAICINKAIEDNVNVINMSLGTKGTSETLKNCVNDAIKKGITVCVSAGNSGAPASFYTPANIESAITVSAISSNDSLPYWANYGEQVDIVAPGVSIYSSYKNGTYETLSGTSMASPFVAAASAMLISKNTSMNCEEIISTFEENGRIWYLESDAQYTDSLYGVKALYIGNISTNQERTISPYFNYESDRYDDEILLEIYCDDPNAKIYYTLDGSRATLENGILYNNEPIAIDKHTLVHAVSCSPNKLKSLQSVVEYKITYTDDESNFKIDSSGVITSYTGNSKYLTIPDTIRGIVVTGIGSNVFASSDIEMIKFPDTLTTIGRRAFWRCLKLYSVTANNIKALDDYAFYYCEGLYKIDLSNIESVGNYSCEDLKIDNLHCDKLTNISRMSFAHMKNLISIDLPNVTTIDNYGLAYNDNCENINLPNVVSISYGGLSSNYKLQELLLPKLETAGNYAFSYLYSLTNFHAPNLQTTGQECFELCKSLEKISLNTKFVDNSTFEDCINLKTIYLPKTEEISKNAFLGCENVKTLFVPCLVKTSSFIECNDVNIYLSDKFTSCSINSPYHYNIIAPSGSYPQQWASTNDHTFLDCESCSFTGVSGSDFVYTCSTNNETCTMPIDLVEQMWYDYLPINKTPDFMTHGYLLDVVQDDFINGKDFAKVHHINKYGW